MLKRQAPALILCIAAACIAASTATGDPSVSAKQAQARQVLAQITQLDGSLHRAQNAYLDSTRELHVIEHNLTIKGTSLKTKQLKAGEADTINLKGLKEGSYEVMNSRLAAGGGEALTQTAIQLLNELKE